MGAKIAGQMVIWMNLCFRSSVCLIRRAQYSKYPCSCTYFSNLLFEGRVFIVLKLYVCLSSQSPSHLFLCLGKGKLNSTPSTCSLERV